jgi:plastocyanin
VTLTLRNEDVGEEHDWEVNNLAMTQTCVGPCTVSVTFRAPAPGSYQFICIVHPDMGGTMVVQ